MSDYDAYGEMWQDMICFGLGFFFVLLTLALAMSAISYFIEVPSGVKFLVYGFGFLTALGVGYYSWLNADKVWGSGYMGRKDY